MNAVIPAVALIRATDLGSGSNSGFTVYLRLSLLPTASRDVAAQADAGDRQRGGCSLLSSAIPGKGLVTWLRGAN